MMLEMWREWILDSIQWRYVIAIVFTLGGFYFFGDSVRTPLNEAGAEISQQVEKVLPTVKPGLHDVAVLKRSVLPSFKIGQDTSPVMRI